MRSPYTYSIYHKPTGLRYYGCRYSKKCDTNDLWITYFTSSPAVHKLIEEHGKNSFIFKVKRVFDTVEACRHWEYKVLRRIDARNHPMFLNETNGGTGYIHDERAYAKGAAKQKAKYGMFAFEQEYVREQQKRTMLEKYGSSELGKVGRMVAQQMGVDPKDLQGLCPHCGKTGQLLGLYRWHYDRCKLNPALMTPNTLVEPNESLVPNPTS